MSRSAALLLVLSASLFAQDDPEWERRKIEQAIEKGAQFLLGKYETEFDTGRFLSTHPLLMYTLLHAKVPRDHPVFKKGLRELEEGNLEYTYQVALVAMTLSALDPRKYQDRLAHCAQWLVDTQLEGGEWGYPHWPPKAIHIDPPAHKTPEAGAGATVPRIKVRRHHKTVVEKEKLKGDISNTQFAILGLRACLEAGIEVPENTWSSAFEYFARNQNPDGGWGYCFSGSKPPDSYASITCAGVVSMILARYAQGARFPIENPGIRKGLDWLSRNYKPEANTNVEKRTAVANPLRYFYLYSIERVGKIAGIEKIGVQEWYPAGARYLLKMQRGDGSWWDGLDKDAWKLYGDTETTDTCFALLFLTTPTRPLVPTEDRK